MNENKAPKRVVDRIFERIETDANTGCWIWPGALSGGYGRIGWRDGGTPCWAQVHRIVWKALKGDISKGTDLDHLCHDPEVCTVASECRHRRCCNPDHLEPVTRKVNLARGGTIPAANSKVTHCPNGHPYDGGNLYFDKKNRRLCRECTRARNREYYHNNKERRSEYNRKWRQRNIKVS